MADSEAAALTEQEREQLHAAMKGTNLDSLYAENVRSAVESILSARLARLADSRPAVGEAAVEAAARLMWEWSGYDNEPGEEGIADRYRHVARAALSAALPHMGDGEVR